MNLKQFKKPIYALLSRGLGLGLQFVMIVFLSRALGAAAMGIYSLFNSWLMIFFSVAEVGNGTSVMRTVSVLNGQQKKHLIRAFVMHALAVVSVAGLLIALLVWWLPVDWIVQLTGDDVPFKIMIMAAIAGIATVIMRVLASALTAMGFINLALTLEKTLLPAAILVLLTAYWLIGQTLTIDAYLIWHILALFFIALLMLVYLIKLTANKTASGEQSPQESAPAALNKSLWSFWGIGIANIVFMNLPFLILPQFASIVETGIFGAAFRLINLGSIVLVTLAAFFGPRFAQLYADKNLAGLRKALRQSQLFSLMVYAPLFLLMMFVPQWLLGLFGDEFVDGAVFLMIMAVGQLINTATGLVGYMMNMMHREKIEFMITLSVLAGVFIMMMILGQIQGVMGIAIAYAIGMAIKNLLSLFFALRHINSLGVIEFEKS